MDGFEHHVPVQGSGGGLRWATGGGQRHWITGVRGTAEREREGGREGEGERERGGRWSQVVSLSPAVHR